MVTLALSHDSQNPKPKIIANLTHNKRFYETVVLHKYYDFRPQGL